ncbi:MAG TPA: amidohydrolase family protein [Anaerolineales bacterium]|nr:amidohydrolase family protein [Anaerolineales bacterium]
MKISIVITLMLALLCSACSAPTLAPTPTLSQASLVLTHGTLIDGTGAPPVKDATLVVGNGHILAVGPASQVYLPSDVRVIDLSGAYILPGFINAHVHDAYDEGRLETWAQAGVTTVRDESIINTSITITEALSLRDQLAISPRYARLVTAGYMITVPGGYGMLEVSSPEEARQEVNLELEKGVDQIKLALESGYAGVTNLPLLTTDELAAIVEAAHAHGSQVTAHITESRYLPLLLEAGVDDLAHVPAGIITKAQMQELIDKNIYVVPTLTVFEAYGGLQVATSTLANLVNAGVSIAMGNDYTLVPQNNFDHFELGMPMHELIRMNEAGMTLMQIVVASTNNAAHVCGLDNELGTLEVGKIADILVLRADPLQDLSALTQVKMVIHSGEIIRE